MLDRYCSSKRSVRVFEGYRVQHSSSRGPCKGGIRAFNEVWEKSGKNGATLRIGAYMVAVVRIVKAKKIRGIFP